MGEEDGEKWGLLVLLARRLATKAVLVEVEVDAVDALAKVEVVEDMVGGGSNGEGGVWGLSLSVEA